MSSGSPATEERLADTHEALLLGREKTIPGSEVLKRLVDGQVVVPLLAPLEIEDGRITGWDPAQVGKPDGTKWLVAFTARDYLDEFCARNPEYATYVVIDMHWVINVLPKSLGIVFNPQTEHMLQWSAAGCAKYREDFLAG